MAEDAHVAVPRWRWIGAVGLVALVIVAGLAWFLIRDHGKPASLRQRRRQFRPRRSACGRW